MYALWVENTSESDPCSYEATKAVAKKAQKKIWGFNRIQAHDLHDISEIEWMHMVNKGPFTLQNKFGTARIKMVRVPKKWFGSDKFYSVNYFAVPNLIRAEPKFHPCSDLLIRFLYV